MDNQFLIQILKDHLNNQMTVLPDGINLSFLVDAAKKQNLEGIVFYQTKIPQLQKSYAAAIYNYTNRKKILDDVKSCFQQENIDFFIVKGFAVSEFYPQPQLRTMGDCDIVVHTEDKEKVHQIMLNLGATCKNQATEGWHYEIKDMLFEVHDHLMYNNVHNSEKAVNFFDNAWNHLDICAIDWNFHFVFLLYHLRKHLMTEGAGFRQFMDLAVVIKNADLDWVKIEEDIKYLDVTEFFERVLMLLKRWFDINVPGYEVAIDQDFVTTVTEKILAEGVFGHENKENIQNRALLDAGKNNKTYRIIRDVFLSYNKMITMEEYSFLKGRKYLLPVAWIYRIILKWKKRDQLKERYFIPDDKVNARMAYLKQWGL